MQKIGIRMQKLEIGTDKIGKKKLERKNWNWNALTDFTVPLTMPPNRDPLFFFKHITASPHPFHRKGRIL